ncbi:hypothetical protein BDF19DRAFT_447574 [Syncephalis fuscata]|nr:hypothetical protein BDF19DRAFT_447574 [Syncephalis fuscata]
MPFEELGSPFNKKDQPACKHQQGSTARRARLQKVSRHRDQQSPPPSSPPDYWDPTFPSTEEIEAQRQK